MCWYNALLSACAVSPDRPRGSGSPSHINTIAWDCPGSRARSAAVGDQLLLVSGRSGTCAMMPTALVTQAARWARMGAWQPADAAEVTGPGTGTGRRPRPLACQAVTRGAAALGSLDHDDAAGQRRDGGAARHQGRHDARRRHATSWQIHLPTSNPAGCKPWHDTAAAATYSIQGYPAARVDMHLNRLHHRSHRGGQGFKSPQLHRPKPQVRAAIGLAVIIVKIV